LQKQKRFLPLQSQNKRAFLTKRPGANPGRKIEKVILVKEENINKKAEPRG
jgi:hypothetical protein